MWSLWFIFVNVNLVDNAQLVKHLLLEKA